MEVDFAFFADAAEVVNGKLYVLSGAVDTINAPEFPFVHPRIALATRLILSPGELGRDHMLEITVMDEDGKRMGLASGKINVQRSAGLPMGWRQGILSVFNFVNARFERPGTYSVDIMVNGSTLKSLPLRLASSGLGRTANA